MGDPFITTPLFHYSAFSTITEFTVLTLRTGSGRAVGDVKTNIATTMSNT